MKTTKYNIKDYWPELISVNEENRTGNISKIERRIDAQDYIGRADIIIRVRIPAAPYNTLITEEITNDKNR